MPRTLTIKFTRLKEPSSTSQLPHPTANPIFGSFWVLSAFHLFASYIYYSSIHGRHLPHSSRNSSHLGFWTLYENPSVRASWSSSAEGGLTIIALNHSPMVVGKSALEEKSAWQAHWNDFENWRHVWQPDFHTFYSTDPPLISSIRLIPCNCMLHTYWKRHTYALVCNVAVDCMYLAWPSEPVILVDVFIRLPISTSHQSAQSWGNTYKSRVSSTLFFHQTQTHCMPPSFSSSASQHTYPVIYFPNEDFLLTNDLAWCPRDIHHQPPSHPFSTILTVNIYVHLQTYSCLVDGSVAE